MIRPVPPTLEHLRARHGDRYKWFVLFTVMIGTMASFTSSTIVDVAIPALSEHFGLGQERAQWASSGFMVAMIPALSIAPWLLQRYGLRRTCDGAVILLMAAGVMGGLSGNFELLIAMRALEGIAAGILQPLPSIVIMRAFGPNEQGRAMGIFGLGVVLAPATAPTLGGYLVEYLGWRSIFFVVVPFGLAALALSRRYLPLVSAFAEGKKPLDWEGLLLIAASTVCFLNGLASLKHPDSALPWVLLGLGSAGIIGFVFHQLRKTDPLVQMRLFLHRPFAVGGFVSFTFGFGVFATTYAMPVFFQMGLAYTPSQAGFVILPAGLALALSMPLSGRLADLMPAPPLIVTGMILVLLSLLLMAFVTPATLYYAVILYAVAGRIGMGIAHPALSIGCVKGLAPKDLAQGFSMNNFIRQLGGAVGISVTGVLIDWRIGVHGASADGMVEAFNECFLILSAICAPAVIAGWFVKERPANKPA